MERTDLVSQYQQILSEGRRRGLAEENKCSVNKYTNKKCHTVIHVLHNMATFGDETSRVAKSRGNVSS